MNSRFCAFALVPALAISVVAVAPAFAQPLPDRAPLVGVVSDLKGAPIAGAVLSLRRSDSKSSAAFWGAAVQADEKGRFDFPDAEEGDYALNIEAPGYASLPYLEVKWRAGNAPVRVTLDRLIDFTLDLRASDGSPVVNTTAFVRLRPSDVNGQKLVTARTNDKGELLVQGVKPGSYSMYLRAPQGFALPGDVAVTEPATPPRAIQLQKGGALKMTVVDALGHQLGGASLTLAPATIAETQRLLGTDNGQSEDFALLAASNNRGLVVSRDGDGFIELDGLPPGVYAPRLSLPGYNFGSLPALTIVAGETAEQKATAPTRRARTLNLQLRTPDDKPYVAGEVSLRILPIAANGQLGGDPPPNPEDADDLPFFPSGPGGRRVLPDAQGRVSLFPVKAGNYRIFAAPQIKEPGQNPPEATPVDVLINASGGNATVVVPNS